MVWIAVCLKDYDIKKRGKTVSCGLGTVFGEVFRVARSPVPGGEVFRVARSPVPGGKIFHVAHSLVPGDEVFRVVYSRLPVWASPHTVSGEDLGTEVSHCPFGGSIGRPPFCKVLEVGSIDPGMDSCFWEDVLGEGAAVRVSFFFCRQPPGYC